MYIVKNRDPYDNAILLQTNSYIEFCQKGNEKIVNIDNNGIIEPILINTKIFFENKNNFINSD